MIFFSIFSILKRSLFSFFSCIFFTTFYLMHFYASLYAFVQFFYLGAVFYSFFSISSFFIRCVTTPVTQVFRHHFRSLHSSLKSYVIALDRYTRHLGVSSLLQAATPVTQVFRPRFKPLHSSLRCFVATLGRYTFESGASSHYTHHLGVSQSL